MGLMNRWSSWRARARKTDPVTSHMAAATVAVTAGQASVLYALELLGGPVTDEQLVSYYQTLRDEGHAVLPQSASGIRTRRRELVDLGLVHGAGVTLNSNGRNALTWERRVRENVRLTYTKGAVKALAAVANAGRAPVGVS